MPKYFNYAFLHKPSLRDFKLAIIILKTYADRQVVKQASHHTDRQPSPTTPSPLFYITIFTWPYCCFLLQNLKSIYTLSFKINRNWRKKNKIKWLFIAWMNNCRSKQKDKIHERQILEIFKFCNFKSHQNLLL